ncbi:MAG: hypothetical protein R6U66_08155 [Bacteroidales bacterium]
MKKVKFTDNHLEPILPYGYPHPSSTLLKGNSMEGKLAFEWAFMADWLKAGGSLVVLLIQWTSVAHFKKAMAKSTDLDIARYEEHSMYVLFDAHLETCEQVDKHTTKANLLEPDTWNKVIDIAELQTKASSLGTLVVGGGLDLLLHSPTYSEWVLETVAQTLQQEKSRSYLMSVSASTETQEMSKWMESVDNLIEINRTHSKEVALNFEKFLYPEEVVLQKKLSISDAIFETSQQLESTSEEVKKQIERI